MVIVLYAVLCNLLLSETYPHPLRIAPGGIALRPNSVQAIAMIDVKSIIGHFHLPMIDHEFLVEPDR